MIKKDIIIIYENIEDIETTIKVQEIGFKNGYGWGLLRNKEAKKISGTHSLLFREADKCIFYHHGTIDNVVLKLDFFYNKNIIRTDNINRFKISIKNNINFIDYNKKRELIYE